MSAWGTFYGVLSAVAYTGANICLRSVTDYDPVWVTCLKAVPTIVVTAPWLLVIHQRGDRVFPPLPVLARLVAAALFGQFAGNLAFQWSLGIIGIALTVPICMGTVIIASAVLGNIYLHETITKKTVVALTILCLAIWILSTGAQTVGNFTSTITQGTAGLLTAAVSAAGLSGIAYSILGVAIRHVVMGKAGVAVTTFSVATVGFVCLIFVAMARPGGASVLQIPLPDLEMIILAGIFNVTAFLALVRALQITSLVNVNALNASQVAMASLAGVVLFHEQTSSVLFAGVGMTIAGLLIMPRHPNKQHQIRILTRSESSKNN